MILDEAFELPPKNMTQISDLGLIVNEDGVKFLRELKGEIADIIFIDPPFNLKKKYEGDDLNDNLSEQNYELFIHNLIIESIRVLKPGGALFFYHIPKWASIFSQILNKHLDFRHWIAIMMKNGYPRKEYLYPAHYALLYYTKGAPNYFNRPKIPVEICRHCGGFIKDYGGYKKYITEGINLADIWTDLSPVRHKKYKNRAANELPVKLLDRVLSISGKECGLIIDPFAGTGTTGVSAIKSKMHFILNDRSKVYCEIMAERLLEVKDDQ